MAFEAIFHKSATLQDVEPNAGGEVELPIHESIHNIHNENAMIMTPSSPGPFKKVQLVNTVYLLSKICCQESSCFIPTG